LFFICLWISTLASAQPVTRIVVPFAAGGVQDIVARSINAELGVALGRSVIVENRAGAGGTIGAATVAKSAPDGQTLILAAASHTIAGSLYAKLPYDPLKDFTPIAHIGNVDYVLLASSTVPAKSLAEFLAPLIERHRELWILRSRPGGLDRSARWLERILAALRA